MSILPQERVDIILELDLEHSRNYKLMVLVIQIIITFLKINLRFKSDPFKYDVEISLYCHQFAIPIHIFSLVRVAIPDRVL